DRRVMRDSMQPSPTAWRKRRSRTLVAKIRSNDSTLIVDRIHVDQLHRLVAATGHHQLATFAGPAAMDAHCIHCPDVLVVWFHSRSNRNARPNIPNLPIGRCPTSDATKTACGN